MAKPIFMQIEFSFRIIQSYEEKLIYSRARNRIKVTFKHTCTYVIMKCFKFVKLYLPI